MFTNADSLINKRTEEALINQQEHKPDVIGVVEIKAKKYSELPLISEFSIKGYDTQYVNVDTLNGRGIILYTASWLNAQPYTPDDVGLGLESVWTTVRLIGKDRLIIGCIYRSPSSLAINYETLNNQIKKAAASSDVSHILIIGDFNYPNINWETGSSVTSAESLFLDAINDSYLYQHVSYPTRARLHQCPSILDLVFTNEDGMLSNLEYMAPLGKSDHSVLCFQLNC